MRTAWILMASGCGGAAPELLCDAAAPTGTRLDAWAGGGMVDRFSYFVSEDGVRQHLLVDGDCRYRAYDLATTDGLPVAQWREGVLTAEEAADVAERLELGSWPASRDDAVPDAGVIHLSFDGDEFECFTCDQDRALVEELGAIAAERVAAGEVVAPIGVDVRAWIGGTEGMAPPNPTDWRFSWTLDRSPADFATTDGTAVAAAPEEIAFFVGVLDEARAGAFPSGQWAFVTEDEGVEYQLYLREVVPAF